MSAQAYEVEVRLAKAVPPILAVGALLKNTICVAAGERAFISACVGNLDNADNFHRFEATVDGMCRHLGLPPALVVHDLHPDFHSTRFARRLAIPTMAVQHHHAHVAAIAAEHGLVGPLIGICMDGFGLGPDNEAWGGELLFMEGADYARIGHLATLSQPGGDVAVREPWRMGAAALWRMGRGSEIPDRFAEWPAAALLPRLLERGLKSPQTSSAGRLFDAACGLLGIYPVAEFEGQAPMALERMVTEPRVMPGGWRIEGGILDLLPLLEALLDCDPRIGADLFHGTLIAALVEWAAQAGAEHGIREIALSGGCFLNRVLSRGVAAGLAARGLVPLEGRRLAPGDSGLSLGQAWVAGIAAVTGRGFDPIPPAGSR